MPKSLRRITNDSTNNDYNCGVKSEFSFYSVATLDRLFSVSCSNYLHIVLELSIMLL